MKRASGSGDAVSIRMVAEAAGVSAATVSNALNGKPSVSPHIARRVREAAEALGYAADNHASRLRSGKRALAGVVVPDLSNPMFGAFVSTLERAARRDGLDLLVVSSANDPAEEAERLRALRSWRPSGLIVIPCDGGLAGRLPPGAMPPIVVADRIPDAPAFDLVAVDNAASAGAMVSHLAANGFRSGLVAGTSLAISNVRERWEGALAAAGPLALTMLECGLAAAGIRETLLARLARGPRPDVLFSLDHVTSLLAFRALAELGLRIGRDIGFASFDETEWMRLVTPPITAVCQPVEQLAEAAWRRLALRMDGDDGSSTVTRFACALQFRGSTLRLPGRPDTEAA